MKLKLSSLLTGSLLTALVHEMVLLPGHLILLLTLLFLAARLHSSREAAIFKTNCSNDQNEIKMHKTNCNNDKKKRFAYKKRNRSIGFNIKG